MNIIERIYTAVEANPHLEQFSGIVFVAQGDKELHFKAVGFAHRAHKILNTKETRFGTASVTKMFTAVSILQLIQKKKISLDTKVVNYLDLRNTRISQGVKVNHLLTHMSGIADYFDDHSNTVDDFAKVWQRKPNYTINTPGDLLSLFVRKKANFIPGSKFRYCNAGYVLLGLVIEKATHYSYFDYVRKNVFRRANMADADFVAFDDVHKNVAEGYAPKKDSAGKVIGWKKDIYTVPYRGCSDGGAFAAADDILQFMRALRLGNLLTKKLTREILTPRVNTQDGWSYGYGMWFQLDKDRVVRYGHGGEDPGVSCRVYYYPSQDIDVIILGNQNLCAAPIMEGIHKAVVEVDSC